MAPPLTAPPAPSPRVHSLIRMLTQSTGAVSTLLGTLTPGYVDGGSSIAAFSFPMGFVIEGSNIFYVADW